jgi:hypothetical protein
MWGHARGHGQGISVAAAGGALMLIALAVGGCATVNPGCMSGGPLGDVQVLLGVREGEAEQEYVYMVFLHMPDRVADWDHVWTGGGLTGGEHTYEGRGRRFQIVKHREGLGRIRICGRHYWLSKGTVFLCVCWTNGYGESVQLAIPATKVSNDDPAADPLEDLIEKHAAIEQFLAEAARGAYPREAPRDPAPRFPPPPPLGEVIGLAARIFLRSFLLGQILR